MSFRRRSGLRPIKSDKHEITWSNLAQNAAAGVAVTLVQGVDSADKNASTEVEVGSHVKFLYLEFQHSAETITSTKIIHWSIQVLRVNQTGTNPNTYYQDNRACIIKRGMEMVPKDVNTIIKRIVAIPVPRVYQRIQKGTTFVLQYIASSAEAINSCGFCIYKEFY